MKQGGRKYRRRTVMGSPLAMQPMYFRKRRLDPLFTRHSEQLHAMKLLDQGANPLSLRNDTPLFWYAAFHEGGAWIRQTQLSLSDLQKPVQFPRGAVRTLLEQTLIPDTASVRHFLGWTKHIAGASIHSQAKYRLATRFEHAQSIAEGILGLMGHAPPPSMVQQMLQRPWPRVHALLEAFSLEAGTPSLNKVSTNNSIKRL